MHEWPTQQCQVANSALGSLQSTKDTAGPPRKEGGRKAGAALRREKQQLSYGEQKTQFYCKRWNGRNSSLITRFGAIRVTYVLTASL